MDLTQSRIIKNSLTNLFKKYPKLILIQKVIKTKITPKTKTKMKSHNYWRHSYKKNPRNFTNSSTTIQKQPESLLKPNHTSTKSRPKSLPQLNKLTKPIKTYKLISKPRRVNSKKRDRKQKHNEKRRTNSWSKMLVKTLKSNKTSRIWKNLQK